MWDITGVEVNNGIVKINQKGYELQGGLTSVDLNSIRPKLLDERSPKEFAEEIRNAIWEQKEEENGENTALQQLKRNL